MVFKYTRRKYHAGETGRLGLSALSILGAIYTTIC